MDQHGISRRRFLLGTGGAAATWLGRDWLLRAEAASSALGAVRPDLTTLRSTFVPTGTGAYRRLVEAPGFPIVVRSLGTEAKAGREARRVALGSVVHLTDIHLIDAQSPARVEFLDRYGDSPTQSLPFQSSYRPQETLTAQVAEAMVQRVNAVAAGPVTGRPFDCAVSTGDSIDNAQLNELRWQMAVLDGGPITPNSGGPGYQGVMDQDLLSYDVHYWHPEDLRPAGDQYKSLHGFPAAPGLLAASVAPFTATGLDVPWYATYGNHDGLTQGNFPVGVLSALNTGALKVVSLPAGLSPGDLVNGLASQDAAVLTSLLAAPARLVTPDPARRPATVVDWVDAHLASPATPGPSGHGLTEDHRDGGPLLFSFPVAPGVLGISLDTCARGGYADGNLFEDQVQRVVALLRRASRAHGGTDQLVVLFSHHNLATLDNPVPDPAKPLTPRVSAAAFEALLHGFPNVVLWVNGHSHVNRVTPHPRPGGGGGFWEVLTAAHVDWPQQSRVVELVDNRDGTLSIFGTLLEHAAPARPAGVGPGRILDLASWSREVSFNDPQANLAAIGAPGDRNVELLLPAPFDLRPGGVDGTVPPGQAGAGAPDEAPELPRTGWSAGAGLAGAAVAVTAAIAARAASSP